MTDDVNPYAPPGALSGEPVVERSEPKAQPRFRVRVIPGTLSGLLGALAITLACLGIMRLRDETPRHVSIPENPGLERFVNRLNAENRIRDVMGAALMLIAGTLGCIAAPFWYRGRWWLASFSSAAMVGLALSTRPIVNHLIKLLHLDAQWP